MLLEGLIGGVTSAITLGALFIPPNALLHPPSADGGRGACLHRRLVCACVAVLWTLSVSILTFHAPFAGSAGNGFFGCWGGLLCAVWVLWHEY